jgi:dihydrofolate reductase
MPKGKGTYGSKKGRPPKKNKRKVVVSRNPYNKNRANKTVITKKGKVKTKNISKKRGDKLLRKGKARRR